MGEKYRQLKWEDRLRLESFLTDKVSKSEIARRLHVTRKTIYNEIARGIYMHRNSDLTEEPRYSSNLAQKRCDENLAVRGTQLKIGKDMEFARYLEEKICDGNLSPEAVLGQLKAEGKETDFKTRICVSTLYSYINKGVFLRLSNKDLPVKGKKKRKYRQVNRRKRLQPGESISDRPETIDTRESFGHWEMDTVVGKRGKSKHSLLVLTERKTRHEILFLLQEHTAAEVVRMVDKLEHKWGQDFSKVFKTITVDNGTEFSDYEGIKQSVLHEGSRVEEVYYCHPYSSWERGSNENANKLVRRHIPKGINFDDKTDEDISFIENWMNSYPRGIFGFRSAADMFREELQKLNIAS